jgi:bacteriocin-like protein
MVGKKKLALKAERLAEITNDELARIEGGVALTGTETYTCPTLPVNNCVLSLRTCTPIITPPTI